MEVETEQPRDNKTNVTTTNQTLGTISTTNQTLSNIPTTNQTIDTITAANQALAATVATDNQRQQGDPSADGSLVTSPITSPGLSNLLLTDYYTIAIMADMLDSPSSVVDSKFNTFLASYQDFPREGRRRQSSILPSFLKKVISGFPLELKNLEKWEYTWKTWKYIMEFWKI